jgi:hypothetical protein
MLHLALAVASMVIQGRTMCQYLVSTITMRREISLMLARQELTELTVSTGVGMQRDHCLGGTTLGRDNACTIF